MQRLAGRTPLRRTDGKQPAAHDGLVWRTRAATRGTHRGGRQAVPTTVSSGSGLDGTVSNMKPKPTAYAALIGRWFESCFVHVRLDCIFVFKIID